MAKPAVKTKTAQRRVPHSLSIIELFSAHADDMIKAAKGGRNVHRTGNISEAGKVFESRFRALFHDSLPRTTETGSGMFMDKKWNLSNQVDFMLCEQAETLQLPPANGLNERYVPHTCVRVFGQLKNTATASEVYKALEQNAASIGHMKTMAAENAADRLNLPYRDTPLSVVVFGNGGTQKMVETALRKLEGDRPTYLVLLEQGMIFVQRSVFEEMRWDTVSFAEQRRNGEFVPCVPDGDKVEAPGRALLWLFFALVFKIKHDNGNLATYGALVEEVERMSPLRPVLI